MFGSNFEGSMIVQYLNHFIKDYNIAPNLLKTVLMTNTENYIVKMLKKEGRPLEVI